MKRAFILSVALLAAWWGIGINNASAQFGTLGQPPIKPRPAVSPYINLGAGGGALSYYGLIRPQMDASKNILDLQQVVTRIQPDGSLRSALDQQSPTNALGGLQTGHQSTYFNYSHYYPLYGPGGTTIAGPGGAGFGTGLGAGLPNPGVGGGAFGPSNRAFFGTNLNTFQR